MAITLDQYKNGRKYILKEYSDIEKVVIGYRDKKFDFVGDTYYVFVLAEDLSDNFYVSIENLTMLEKDMLNLEVGDVLFNEAREKTTTIKRVVAPGLYVHEMQSDNYYDPFCSDYPVLDSAEGLELKGFSIKSEVKEMTVADVEKLVGSKVKIVKGE